MEVHQIESKETDSWLLTKHYAKRKCQRMFCFGLFNDHNLEGIVTFGMPPSPQVGRGWLGEDYRTKVIELNRLCINESAPVNSASFLVGRSLRLMKDWAVVSYADSAMGHVGYVYQACNFIYCGATKSHDKEYWIDGKWVHAKVLTNRGITAPALYAKKNQIATKLPEPKHRYIFFGDKSLQKHLKYEAQAYPKGETKRYDCADIVNSHPTQMSMTL